MNVFEVSTIITLVDRVSPALAQVSRQFATTATAASALQNQLSKISTLYSTGLMQISAGAALVAPIAAATKHAEEYAHTLNQMNVAGRTQKEIAESVGAAWKLSGSVLTSTVTENLKAIADLRTIFNSTDEAIKNAPFLTKIQSAYGGVLDAKMAKAAEGQTYSMAKALDMIGKVTNPAEFNRAAESMFKVTAATHGRVMPSDYQAVYKYAKQARMGLGDDFLYKLLPELIIENKTSQGGGASRVGNQIASLYKTVFQGVMSKQTAMAFAQMGLIDQSAMMKTATTGTALTKSVLGKELFAKNPNQWIQEILLPRLAKANNLSLNEVDKLAQASTGIFTGNSLAGGLVSELIKKNSIYARFGPQYDKTMGVEKAYQQSLLNDPLQANRALHAQISNLVTAIGKDLTPVIQKAKLAVARTMSQITEFVNQHPKIVQTTAALIAAAGGLLMVGGALKVVKAAVMGLGIITRIVPGLAGLTSETTAFGRVALVARAALGPLGLTIAAVALVVKNWDGIMGFVHQHANFFIHIAAETVRAFRDLSIGLQSIFNQVAYVLDVIGPYLGDKFSGQLADISSALTQATTVSAKQALLDRSLLQSQGMGFVVDAATGQPAPNAMATARGGGGTVINAPYSPTINLSGSANEEKTMQALKKLLQEDRREQMREISKSARRMPNATTGNTTSRSVNTLGRVTP